MTKEQFSFRFKFSIKNAYFAVFSAFTLKVVLSIVIVHTPMSFLDFWNYKPRHNRLGRDKSSLIGGRKLRWVLMFQLIFCIVDNSVIKYNLSETTVYLPINNDNNCWGRSCGVLTVLRWDVTPVIVVGSVPNIEIWLHFSEMRVAISTTTTHYYFSQLSSTDHINIDMNIWYYDIIW